MKARFLVLIGLVAMLPLIVLAQSDREYTDKLYNYRIVLIGDWRPVSYTDAVGRHKTDFVFCDRDQGLLTISKERIVRGSLATKVRDDLDDMRLRLSLADAKQEAFCGGQSDGIRVTIFYFKDGRRVAGTYYYLRDSDSAWILRFTGNPESQGIAPQVTDRIARSFCSVCPFQ